MDYSTTIKLIAQTTTATNDKRTFTFKQWVDIIQKDDTLSYYYYDNDDDDGNNEICEVIPVMQLFNVMARRLLMYAKPFSVIPFYNSRIVSTLMIYKRIQSSTEMK